MRQTHTLTERDALAEQVSVSWPGECHFLLPACLWYVLAYSYLSFPFCRVFLQAREEELQTFNSRVAALEEEAAASSTTLQRIRALAGL